MEIARPAQRTAPMGVRHAIHAPMMTSTGVTPCRMARLSPLVWTAAKKISELEIVSVAPMKAIQRQCGSRVRQSARMVLGRKKYSSTQAMAQRPATITMGEISPTARRAAGTLPPQKIVVSSSSSQGDAPARARRERE